MDINVFKAIVTKVGENKILAIGFDNSTRKCFTTDAPFSMAKHYDVETNCLVFDEHDTRKVNFKVWKNITDIQSVITVEDETTKDVIDQRYISA
jgi:hypothetical protein